VTAVPAADLRLTLARPPQAGGWARATRNPRVLLGAGALAALILAATAAPLLGTIDPISIDPSSRNLPIGASHPVALPGGGVAERVAPLGTDGLGRDIYSRVLYGGRVSLFIGFAAAAASATIGLAVGLAAGYLRWADLVLMRVMDGLMAIPGVLLAIGLMAVWRPGIGTVIAAIVIPEFPRVARLVRSVVLRVRQEPYVEAAIASGTPVPMLLLRHVAPNMAAPMSVQCAFACATAVLIEAALSFLGAGVPVETPSWGNAMAEGRQWFSLYPHMVLIPGAVAALAVLSVNVLGEGLREAFDPRAA
jgi:peptide/nickel transport system permease protein